MGLLKSNLITLTGGSSVSPADPTLKLDLEFSSMTALPASITFARASIGTYFDQNGAMQTAVSGQARFDHDPVTLEPLGLLIEGTRTNSLLNSAAPVTQNVTVTAASWTLSFYGTGSVAMSGAYVGTVNGAGAYPARRYMTFTPTAGTLTLTPTGNVEKFQLELGAFATSYIPTTTAAVPRAFDSAFMTGANLTSWYTENVGTFVARIQVTPPPISAFPGVVGKSNNSRWLYFNFTPGTGAAVYDAGTALTQTPVPVGNTTYNIASACDPATSLKRIANNGVVKEGVYNNTMDPAATAMNIGSYGAVVNALNGTIASLKYFNVAKTDAELIELTTP